MPNSKIRSLRGIAALIALTLAAGAVGLALRAVSARAQTLPDTGDSAVAAAVSEQSSSANASQQAAAPQSGSNSTTTTAGDKSANQTIRAESKTVRVDVVVTDKEGKYVHDLDPKDFKVYDDKKEQSILTFTKGDDRRGRISRNLSITWCFFSTTRA